MDQHLRYWSQIRHMSWQGSELTALKCQTRGNGISTPGHRALLIAEAILAKLCIDGFQVSSLWKRHEIIPSCIPNQILDASFLPASGDIGKAPQSDRHCESAETGR